MDCSDLVLEDKILDALMPHQNASFHILFRNQPANAVPRRSATLAWAPRRRKSPALWHRRKNPDQTTPDSIPCSQTSAG